MKKLISILLAAMLILAAALMLTGCSVEPAEVSSALNITSAFRGSRVVTVKYPLSTDIDAIKDTILADDPTDEVEGVTFSYRGVEGDGYYFELLFEFIDREDYEREVTAVIGRTATAFLSRKDTVLTRGTRMAENFDVSDLIAWILRATESDSATKGVEFRYPDNTVTIDSDEFTTGSTIAVNSVEGSTVNSVSIRTSNDKEGHFDRTFVFSVPNESYVAAQEAFEAYFDANTADAAEYAGWSAEGVNMTYTVIYKGLSLRTLIQYTGMLLDTDNVSIYYGDKDNASTPLYEGLAFEESLDTFSFIGPDRGAVTLQYDYSLPVSTVHGDGAVFTDGRWIPAGAWTDGVYQVEMSSGSVQLRIPDGVQYAISGIDFRLESLGGERFRRTTDFRYSKTDGSAGMNYAAAFFTAKGFRASTGEDENSLICSVICEGTTSALTAELVRLFGSGNFMAYRSSSSTFSLATKTTFTDYIDLSSILNSTNAACPMRYYVSSSSGENIVSLSLDGSEKAYSSAEKSYLSLSSGVGTVEYYGSIPITSHIIIYLLVGLSLLCATVFLAYSMLRQRKSRISAGAQRIVDAAGLGDDDDEALPSLTQTTTFSIAELGVLSRNKRYVEEIDKDVEQRIEADRLTARKKEIRQKELAEMERKVYGPQEESLPDDVPELNIDALRIPPEEDVNLDALRIPSEEDASAAPDEPDSEPEHIPEPPVKQLQQTVNPFSLLDEPQEEDNDD